MSSEVTPLTPWMKEAAHTLSWVTTAALGKPAWKMGELVKAEVCVWLPPVVAGGIAVRFVLNWEKVQ